MQDTFKPQMTTLNSFSEIEQSLFDDFVEFGYDGALAKTIAHTFTNYMLGYLTAEGAAQSLLSGGADEPTARGLVETFREVKGESGRSVSPPLSIGCM